MGTVHELPRAAASEGGSAIAAFIGLTPAQQQAAIARATVQPILIRLAVTNGGATFYRHYIRKLRGQHEVDEVSLLEPGDHLLRSDVLPIERLHYMPREQRRDWSLAYAAYLMWRRAESLGKRPNELRCWEDYDPIQMDEDLRAWLRPGRHVGD